MSDRVSELQSVLAETGATAAVLRLPENVLLLSGYWTQIPGLGLVVVPREGQATLLVPDWEADEAGGVFGGDVRTFPAIRHDREPTATAIARLLRDLAAEHGATGGPVGFEGSFETLAPPAMAGEPAAVGLPSQALYRDAFAARELIDLTEQLEELRTVKSPRDLEGVTRANEIATLGLEAFCEHVRPGRSEVEIMAAVEGAMVRGGHGHRGARAVRAYATVCSGPDLTGGWQYFRSRTRQVEHGDVVMLELGTVVDGYWADHTRTVVAGRARPEQRAAYAAVRAACDAAFQAAVPGATGDEVDAAARRVCAQAGFEQFPHHTGHGTGFRYHESRPRLAPGSTHVLREGMVLAGEPGIYGAELGGGFRHEDDAVVTPSGAQVLAGTDYGLEA